MATNTRIRTSAATALTLVALALTSLSTTAQSATGARPRSTGCGGSRVLLATGGPAAPRLRLVRTALPPQASTPAYSWPLKPFGRQHPVRAFFDDPRVGGHGSHAFHFGIDIAAPDGTPVYAVEAGTVHVGTRRSVAVVSPDSSHVFGYWHIVPAVESHQIVRRHQLLGHVDTGWEHVHFAERRGGVYVNPLRPGGLGPYADRIVPTIAEIAFAAAGGGNVSILVDAFDMPSPRVPGAWADEPVTPALLRWRLLRSGRPATGWRTAADFRSTMLPAHLYPSVYAPSTRQNHEGAPGRYCFYLARAWKPADGRYRLEVRASDTRGNRAEALLDFGVSGGSVRR